MCNKWKICSQFFFLYNQLVMLNIMNLWGTLAMHIFLLQHWQSTDLIGKHGIMQRNFFFLLLFVYDTFVCIACLALLKQIQYHFTNSSQTLPRYKRSGLYAYSAWTTAFSKRKYNTPSPVTQKMKTADKLHSKDTFSHIETIWYTNADW